MVEVHCGWERDEHEGKWFDSLCLSVFLFFMKTSNVKYNQEHTSSKLVLLKRIQVISYYGLSMKYLHKFMFYILGSPCICGGSESFRRREEISP